MEEIWKKLVIIENDGLEIFKSDYEISNYGNVRRFSNKKDVKQFFNSYGYKCISINMCDGVKNFLVHRLVAFDFIPNQDNKPQINHKNKIRYDNNVLNLEWCTQAENNRHASKTKRGKLTTV